MSKRERERESTRESRKQRDREGESRAFTTIQWATNYFHPSSSSLDYNMASVCHLCVALVLCLRYHVRTIWDKSGRLWIEHMPSLHWHGISFLKYIHALGFCLIQTTTANHYLSSTYFKLFPSVFPSWKLMKPLINSGLSALKSGRSSVVELRFVLTVYKPRVLVFSICVAYTWAVDTVHLVTCLSPAFEGGRKSVVSALHTIFQPLWLSRAAKPMMLLRLRCLDVWKHYLRV